MGNTSDLEMVQKMIIGTLHKESKSQRVITERVDCSRSAVSKYIKSWLEGINREEKSLLHKQQGWPQAWEYCQAKPIQTLGRASQGVKWSQCIKSHHTQTSSGKELQSHFWNRNIIRSILPGIRKKMIGLLLSGPKSSFQMRVNMAFHLEIKVHVAWSPVWSFHSQWWFGLPCPLLVLVHCVFWSPVNAAIYQDILEHFMLPSADKLYGDADLIFHKDLAPAHTAKGTKSCFNDHGVTVLDWPANSPVLIPKGNQWGIVKRKMRHQTQQCRWSEGRYQSNLGFHYTGAVPQADCLHATPHWCSNSCKRRPNQVLSA